MQTTQQATRDGSRHRTVAGNGPTPARHAEPTAPPNVRGHQTIRRFLVTPGDAGNRGVVDGGTLLEWIDEVAHAVAAEWSGRRCVTAWLGNVHLDRPISVGELVELHAGLVYTGRSSMHILVTIHSSDPSGANAVQTAQCAIVFVAVDQTGDPVEVPPWRPVTMLELQRHRQARVRVRMRERIQSAMAAESYTAEGTAPRTTARFVTDPTDANGSGHVHGGRVMRWIDEAAAVCGTNWTGAQIITSYIAGIRFHGPVTIGDAVEVTARIIHTGPRSVHISVHVSTTDAHGGQAVAHGVAVVVALDECGNARPVPKWHPDSDEDRRLDRHARHLIELRQFIEPFTTAAAPSP
jgi:acyl-CoA hydrolase